MYTHKFLNTFTFNRVCRAVKPSPVYMIISHRSRMSGSCNMLSIKTHSTRSPPPPPLLMHHSIIQWNNMIDNLPIRVKESNNFMVSRLSTLEPFNNKNCPSKQYQGKYYNNRKPKANITRKNHIRSAVWIFLLWTCRPLQILDWWI